MACVAREKVGIEVMEPVALVVPVPPAKEVVGEVDEVRVNIREFVVMGDADVEGVPPAAAPAPAAVAVPTPPTPKALLVAPVESEGEEEAVAVAPPLPTPRGGRERVAGMEGEALKLPVVVMVRAKEGVDTNEVVNDPLKEPFPPTGVNEKYSEAVPGL